MLRWHHNYKHKKTKHKKTVVHRAQPQKNRVTMGVGRILSQQQLLAIERGNWEYQVMRR